MARMLEYHTSSGGKKYLKDISGSDVWIMFGTAATRATVRADGGDEAPVGSVYFSNDGGATTAPKVYFKIADAKANADWERLVTAAAD
jgi:hypothetical protein